MDEQQAAQWRRARAWGEWRYIALQSLRLGAIAAWFVVVATMAVLPDTCGYLPGGWGPPLRVAGIVFLVFSVGGAFRAWARWTAREREYGDYEHGGATRDPRLEV
jgi:hypothetical protein